MLIFAVVAVSCVILIMLLIHFTPQPPANEMEYARESISLAAKSKADTYSRKLYNQASVFYDSAMVNWQKENNRFIYFRNYDKVLKFAELSAQKANQAADNSRSSTSNLKTTISQKIDFLRNLVTELNLLFTKYPLTAEIRNRISGGKMLLEEAEIAFKKGQYLQSNRKLTDAEYLLTASYDNANENLKSYFNSYSVWKNWVQKTINDSRKNSDYSIIIDKFSRKCLVYHSGAKKYEFEAELGKNWVGDKREKGDHATPEGMYRIIKKFDSRKTKYYKALLLDYPNDKDRENFKKEIASGSLSPSAKIGGLIEIHGDGGKGIDWTEGCVALANKDMDVIYRIARVGTPVTIVGSVVALENIVRR